MRRLVTALSIAIFLVLGSKTNLKAQYTDWPETIRIQIDNYTSFEMVKVEAGYFEMGCTSEQLGDCSEKELPKHGVYITNDYYIGKFEVTQKVWKAVMGFEPKYRGMEMWAWEQSYGKGDNYPAYGVTYYQCQEFCEKLSRMTGYRFRLPTEAEWEYAARGGNKSSHNKYSGSNSINKVAWYGFLGNSENKGNSNGHVHPVGTLLPNELGIYDMSGNVWEWCSDWYRGYDSDTQINPQCSNNLSDACVVRGGSFLFGPNCCRVSYRGGGADPHGTINNDSGFRVVLFIEQN